MKNLRSVRLFLAFILASVFCFSARAQVTTGTPPFGTFSGGPDVINLANLNSHITVPVLHKAGRGLPFAYDLSYDTAVWYPTSSSGTLTWQPTYNWGWRGQSEANTGYVSFTEGESICYYYQGQVKLPGSFHTWYTNYIYHDAWGVPHPFSGISNQWTGSGNGGCDLGTNNGFSSTTTDGSGYTIGVPTPPGGHVAVTARNGNNVTPPVGSGAGAASQIETNGNQVTINSSGQFYDTLSSSTPVLTVAGTAPSPTTFTYTAPGGSSAQYTMKYTTYTVQTNFGCSGIVEFGATSESLVSEIDLPNGTKYTFTYEATPGHSGNVTGRLASVTLTSGGTISYAYSGGSNGIVCADGSTATLTRTTPDGTGTYVHSENGSTWTTTETDPQMPYDSAANQTIYTFNSSAQITQKKIYQGSSTSGTLLRTINTTWATNSTPATEITILEDNSTQSERETTYDSFGDLLTLKEHDYGAGAPGSILRTTTNTYLSASPYTNLNIMDRVTEQTIADSTGTIQYREDTAYDGTTISPCPTGVPQHNDSNYSCSFSTRGNPTSVTTYTNAAAKTGGITKNSYYNVFGNRVQADADCCQTMGWNLSATTEYSAPDSVVRGTISGTHLTSNYTYNSHTGQIASIVDPNNQTTWFAYDPMLRPTTIIRPDSAQVVQTYNDSLNTVSNTQPIQGTATITRTDYQDGLGRTSQTSVFDASSNLYSTTQTEYDGMGRPYNISNPFTTSAQYWTETTYDALGRKLKIMLPDGSQTTFVYSGASITETDPAGHQRKMQTDGLNRLSAVYEPDPTNGNSLTLQTSYAYTVSDQLATVTQGSQTRTYSYDGMGRLISRTLPESGTTSFQYNSYNLISQRTDARGVITSYTYDTMNRLYQISYNVGTTGVPPTPTVTYTYGTNSSQYNNGRVLTLTDGLGTTTYSYDNLARATQAQHVINGSTYTIGYQYNLAGEVTSLIYPSNRVVQRSFDAIGRLSSLSSGTTTYASSFSYNSAFAPTSLTMGNGVAVALGYSANRLQLQSLVYTDGSTVLSTAYSYSQNGGNNGQITGITDNVDSGRSIAYTYDALNRLSTSLTTGSTNYPQWGLSFTYDRYGNRTAQTVTAGTAYANSVAVSATTNHITTSGYAYDLNGNLTNDGVNAIGYDGENRVVSSTGSAGSGSYSYRASGLRAVKVSGGTTTVYLFDGDRDIAEYANGTLANEYIYWGNKAIASYLSGTLYYHAYDHQSIRVHMDTSGNIAGKKGHYSFGEDWYTSSLTNRHFTTYERDSESSNDNALHRFYVNRLGRFSASDPLPHGGQNPQGFNLYNYAHSDPVNRLDPDGREDCLPTVSECDCNDGPFVVCYPGWTGDPPGGGCDPSTGIGCKECNPEGVEGNSCPPSEPTPEPPPPTPSCFVQLKNRTVDVFLAKIFHAQHDFWYVQDDSGFQWFLEAGPSNPNGTGFLTLNAKLYPGDPNDVSAHAGFTVSSPGVCTSVSNMELATYTFLPFLNPYKPITGPNSNSAAHYLAGIGGFSPHPPFWSPGWNTPVIGNPFIF